MIAFFKREMTFTVALIATLVSFLFVGVQPSSFSSVDFRILALLFCLMGISSGLKKAGFFNSLAHMILKACKNGRVLFISLVSLVFFSSMLVTNDVALIIFVPFSIMMLKGRLDDKSLAALIVLETIGANLGSMATPVGNPQNLFLYSYYSLDAASFFSVIVPVSALSYLLLILLCLMVSRKAVYDRGTSCSIETERDMRSTAFYFVFLLLALLSVFRILDWRILFALLVVFLLFYDKSIFLKVDYVLLLTFVCFFIFSANISMIHFVRNFLSSLMESHPFMTGILTSQVISNVPSAVLLAPFCNAWKALLLAVDVGGLGTPVASLASLIGLKYYLSSTSDEHGYFMFCFAFFNIVLLLVLAFFSLLLI